MKNDSNSLYYDGKIVAAIKSNEIPGCLTLVVKNNERIRLNRPTLLRSASYDDAYEFINEAFDGLNKQPVSLRTSVMLSNQLSPVVVAAYNEIRMLK